MFRRSTEVEPEPMRTATLDVDPQLRDEVDPDPLIEEMVARLREGLSSLHAVDEWGRPIAWRNVVRLALGPLANRLRDTEQALEIAVSMIPTPEDAGERRVEERRSEDRRTESSPLTDPLPSLTAEAPAAPEASEVAAPAVAEPPAAPLAAAPEAPEALQAPAGEVQGHLILQEEPIVVDVADDVEPPVVVRTVTPTAPLGATSVFSLSGDQRAVPVPPFHPSQVLGGSGTDHPPAP